MEENLIEIVVDGTPVPVNADEYAKDPSGVEAQVRENRRIVRVGAGESVEEADRVLRGGV